MTSQAAADELRRALVLRIEQLTFIVRGLKGPLGKSRSDLVNALDLVGQFPTDLRAFAEDELNRAVDVGSQISILLPLLRHLNYVLNFVETHLSHGNRHELSDALSDEVRHELQALNLAHYGVVLSHGEAYNYETVHGDLAGAFFGPLAGPVTPTRAPEMFALFKVPRLEGGAVQWRPVLLGHEVAHVAVKEFDAVAAFDLWAKFDVAAASKLTNPKSPGSPNASTARGLYQIAEAWATELICDAQALHRFGPAAIAALGEYLTCIGAMTTPTSTHPLGQLRVRLLLDQAGVPASPRLQAVIEPWADLVPAQVACAEPWAQYLSDMFTSHISDLPAAAASLPAPQYQADMRTTWIDGHADRLRAGVPGREALWTTAGLAFADRADAINAAWVARCEQAATPFDQLAQKAIESIDFVERWRLAGGIVPDEPHQVRSDTDMVLAAEAAGSLLSADRLLERIRLRDPDKGLVVTPLLHLPKGTGLDVRLGTRFIAFKRSGIASFDPLSETDDPRSVQSFYELSRSERFVLHPSEVVLGVTMEYLVLPDDLAGQVITRSSYGRLGLLSATAVQVHPRFHGCLTLELVNLSNIPITLTPGERIAQLVLWKSDVSASSGEKYAYSIGPEFSRVRDDREADTLRVLRQG